MRQVVLVGGVPAPAGGVTTFLRRLMIRDAARIALLVDLYPGEKESLGPALDERIRQLGSPLRLFPWLARHGRAHRDKAFFFNFSTVKAIAPFALTPKPRGSHWQLMLHHGTLTAPGGAAGMAVRRALGRFDLIYTLSDGQ